jgi:LAO/AO transport system kinase
MLDGDRLALARLITRIENRMPDVSDIMRAIHERTGRAYVLGITGPPGAGKSTLVDRVTSLLRAEKIPVRTCSSAAWPPGAASAAWPAPPAT